VAVGSRRQEMVMLECGAANRGPGRCFPDADRVSSWIGKRIGSRRSVSFWYSSLALRIEKLGSAWKTASRAWRNGLANFPDFISESAGLRSFNGRTGHRAGGPRGQDTGHVRGIDAAEKAGGMHEAHSAVRRPGGDQNRREEIGRRIGWWHGLAGVGIIGGAPVHVSLGMLWFRRGFAKEEIQFMKRERLNGHKRDIVTGVGFQRDGNEGGGARIEGIDEKEDTGGAVLKAQSMAGTRWRKRARRTG